MTENDIIQLFRKYKCLSKELLTALLKATKNRDKKFLERSLKRMTDNKTIISDNGQIFYMNGYEKNYDIKLIKALWVLTQFNNIKEHYPGSDMVLIAFITRNDELFEIVHLSGSTFRITVTAINRDIDKNYMPKRIVIADSETDANALSTNVLQEINCVALCTVSEDGNINSYEWK